MHIEDEDTEFGFANFGLAILQLYNDDLSICVWD